MVAACRCQGGTLLPLGCKYTSLADPAFWHRGALNFHLLFILAPLLSQQHFDLASVHPGRRSKQHHHLSPLKNLTFASLFANGSMQGECSFAPVAACRRGSANDEPPRSPKPSSSHDMTTQSCRSATTHRTFPEATKAAPTSDTCTGSGSATAPFSQILIPAITPDSDPDSDPELDDFEVRLAVALKEIRGHRRQRHAKFKSVRVRNTGSRLKTPQPLATVASEPPLLLARDSPPKPGSKAPLDRPITPDPDENGWMMPEDEGFGDEDNDNDTNGPETTLALWRLRANSTIRQRNYPQYRNAAQAARQGNRVLKSKPRMRRRRTSPAPAHPPAAAANTTTSTADNGPAP